MPGFDIDRINSTSEAELEELTCSICHGIFNKPVFTNCCLQIFCKDCIEGWIKSSKSCPYDRKELSTDKLSQPPRLVLNMLSKLKINCMYEKNGCKEILFVDSLESHEKTCRFEKRICVLCACEVLKKHNCIESLLKKNKELVEKVEILEKNLSSSLKHNITLNKNIEKKNSELEKVSKELAEIHKKHENKKKYEIDDVSKKAETQRKREVDLPLPSSSSKVGIADKLTQAKQFVYKPVTLSQGRNDKLFDALLCLVQKTLISKTNINDISISLNNKMKRNNDGYWHCCVYFEDFCSINYTCDPDLIFKLKFGELIVDIHKDCDKVDLIKTANLLNENKLINRLFISDTNMNKYMQSTVKNVVIFKIKESNSPSSITINICKELSKRFNDTWNCFAYNKCSSTVPFHPGRRNFMKLVICSIEFLIFQDVDKDHNHSCNKNCACLSSNGYKIKDFEVEHLSI